MLQSIHFQDVGLCFKEILVNVTLILTLTKSGALANSSRFYILHSHRFTLGHRASLNTVFYKRWVSTLHHVDIQVQKKSCSRIAKPSIVYVNSLFSQCAFALVFRCNKRAPCARSLRCYRESFCSPFLRLVGFYGLSCMTPRSWLLQQAMYV